MNEKYSLHWDLSVLDAHVFNEGVGGRFKQKGTGYFRANCQTIPEETPLAESVETEHAEGRHEKAGEEHEGRAESAGTYCNLLRGTAVGEYEAQL